MAEDSLGARVDVSRRDRGGLDVWHLRLNDPTRAQALSTSMVELLHGALDDAERTSADVVVVESAGPVFSAGFDLSDLESETDADLLLRFCRIQLLLDRLRSGRAVSVAMIVGAAVGAGADLAMSCDLRIAGPHASVRFPGVSFGAALGTTRLGQAIGPEATKGLLLNQESIDASRGSDLGIWRAATSIDGMQRLLATDLQRIGRMPPGAWRRISDATDRTSLHDDLGRLVCSLVAEPGLKERMGHFLDGRAYGVADAGSTIGSATENGAVR